MILGMLFHYECSFAQAVPFNGMFCTASPKYVHIMYLPPKYVHTCTPPLSEEHSLSFNIPLSVSSFLKFFLTSQPGILKHI